MLARKSTAPKPEKNKFLEQWIWDAACSIRGAKDAPKYKDFILPLEPADPEQPVWSVIRKLSDKIGEGVTSHMRAIAKENPPLQGIIDRVDFNATTHGQRDIDDDRLSSLIEKISEKRLGLEDVEADIIGKSYEQLISKFSEGSYDNGKFDHLPSAGDGSRACLFRKKFV